MMSILACELGGVWKFFQNRIVPCRLQVFQCETEDRIQPSSRVADVEIEGRELMTKMQLRIVIERTTEVTAQLLFERPSDHVAHRVKVKVKIEGHIVIESDDFIIKRVAEYESQTESDDTIVDPPNKKTRVSRHRFRDSDKKLPT